MASIAPMNGNGPYMVKSPLWCLVVRGCQGLFALAILGISADLISSLALNAPVFALVCSLMTFIIVTYALVTELVSDANVAHNIWAVLSLDLLMAVFWLSSMAANAALRATFKTTPTEDVVYWKRDIYASSAALSEMSALAGVSALMMFLHIATLSYNGHCFRMYAQTTGARPNEGTVEMKAQEDPMLNPQQAAGQQGQQYQQYADQQQYQPQMYQHQHQHQQQQQMPQPEPTPVPQAYDANYYPQQQYDQQQYDQQQPAQAPVYSNPSPAPYQHQMPPAQDMMGQQQHPYQPPQ